MKKLALTVAILSISTLGATAADLAPQPYYTKAPAPVPAAYNWSGGYVGIEGGYGWGHSDQTDSGIPAAVVPPVPPPVVVSILGDGHYSLNGGLVGGTAGYNWQTGPIVFGLEGDYSWSDIQGSSNVCGPTTATPHPCGTELDSLGTFRGRIGYAMGATGNWLLYATGGLAVGDVHGSDALTPASGGEFRAGWTVGAGVEVAVAPNWTVKAEYLHVDLGSAQLFDIVPGVPETVSFRADIVRAGINYHFNLGAPLVARY
jgi:outer membrane immunogenic protein